MFAKNETEFVILKLMYVPPHGEIRPPVVLRYQKLLVPPSRPHPLRDWVMLKEESSLPNGNSVEFCMWKIRSHDTNLFTVYNIRFDKLIVFIGEETIHWIFYIHEPLFACRQGVTALTLSYCRCCFDGQYLKFVERIHKDNQDPNCCLLS